MSYQTLTIRTAAVSAILVVSAGKAHAQTCLGQANPANTAKMISTTAAGTDLGRSVIGRYGVVGDRLFGGVQLGAAGGSFDAMYAPVVGIDIGLRKPLNASGSFMLCPMLQTTFQNGSNAAPYLRNSLATSLGLAIGRSVRVTNSIGIVPFMQVGVQHVYQRFDYGLGSNGERLAGSRGHNNPVFGEMAAGFGLRLGERFTLTPAYRIPLGSANRTGIYQQAYSLGVTFGIPR